MLKDIINGQSIGKRIMKIAIRSDIDNSKVSIVRLILRNIFIFIWPIDLLVFLCSKQKKRLGDILNRTDIYDISIK